MKGFSTLPNGRVVPTRTLEHLRKAAKKDDPEDSIDGKPKKDDDSPDSEETMAAAKIARMKSMTAHEASKDRNMSSADHEACADLHDDAAEAHRAAAKMKGC